MVILVVGATGQVGSLVVRQLRGAGVPVQAMVRDPASATDLAATGAELAIGDLCRPETLDAALDGVTAVVATANAVAPVRAGDTATAVDARLCRARPAGRTLRRLPLRARQRARDTAGRAGPGRPHEAAHRTPARGLRPLLAVPPDDAVHRGLAGTRRQRGADAGRGPDHPRQGVPDPAPLPADHRPHDRTQRRHAR